LSLSVAFRRRADASFSDAVPFVTGNFLSWTERGIPMQPDLSALTPAAALPKLPIPASSPAPSPTATTATSSSSKALPTCPVSVVASVPVVAQSLPAVPVPPSHITSTVPFIDALSKDSPAGGFRSMHFDTREPPVLPPPPPLPPAEGDTASATAIAPVSTLLPPGSMLHSHRQWHVRMRLPVGAHLFFVFGVRDLELVSRRLACVQHVDLEARLGQTEDGAIS
jgi:hypothetical protein